MPQKGKKNINVNIDKKIADEFARQTDERGYTKYRAVEGAFRLWLQANPDEQVKQINGIPKPAASDEDLDAEIRAFAREFAILTSVHPHIRISCNRHKCSMEHRVLSVHPHIRISC